MLFSMSYFGDPGFRVCIGDTSTVLLQIRICAGFSAREHSFGKLVERLTGLD